MRVGLICINLVVTIVSFLFLNWLIMRLIRLRCTAFNLLECIVCGLCVVDVLC